MRCPQSKLASLMILAVFTVTAKAGDDHCCEIHQATGIVKNVKESIWGCRCEGKCVRGLSRNTTTRPTVAVRTVKNEPDGKQSVLRVASYRNSVGGHICDDGSAKCDCQKSNGQACHGHSRCGKHCHGSPSDAWLDYCGSKTHRIDAASLWAGYCSESHGRRGCANCCK